MGKAVLYAGAGGAAVVCHFYLDRPTARLVDRYLFGNVFWQRYAGDIPDALFWIVCIISIVAWISYISRRKRNICDPATTFFHVIAYAAPASYGVKALLKYVFGRMGPREWLTQPDLYGFHWFHGGGVFAGFPSGHMVVFSTVVAAASRYFPRYRNLCRLLLLIIGVALVATNYHFPGDVIAGAGVGLLLEWSVTNLSGENRTRVGNCG